MLLTKLNTINTTFNYKQIILFEKCILYVKKTHIFQINFLNRSQYNIPLKIYYNIKNITADKHGKFFILTDLLNHVLFIQRPLFIISHIIKTKYQPIDIHISLNNNLIAIIYKNLIEVWGNQRKYSISIQKLKKIKLTLTILLQSMISHDLRYVVLLDTTLSIITVLIENNFVQIHFLQNYHTTSIKKFFIHYLLLFINKKKNSLT